MSSAQNTAFACIMSFPTSITILFCVYFSERIYPVKTRDSLEGGTLLSATTAFAALPATVVLSEAGMVGEDLDQQLVGSLFELVHDAVVQGILVLLQPASDVVVDDTSIVSQAEVGRLAAGFRWLGLQEGRRLAQVVGVQLVLKRLVRRFGEHRLFFQNGENTHRLMVDGTTSISR